LLGVFCILKNSYIGKSYEGDQCPLSGLQRAGLAENRRFKAGYHITPELQAEKRSKPGRFRQPLSCPAFLSAQEASRFGKQAGWYRAGFQPLVPDSFKELSDGRFF
ncbi:MAG: hypothetical protein KBA08_08325, partial [Firmicutes bacterium]|nr:hypothetical protein [Bacillota bacterium]